MPHGIPPHLVDSLSRPFTPVSPSNLDPITARFQQVTIADVNYFQDTLSGSVTPSASAKNAEHSFFDEEDDRRREVRADAERPFPVDRDILREIVHENMGSPVVYLRFLSSGTFHKAFLAHLADGRELVARIARRFMPQLKVESEVATINYIRTHTKIPVPTIYHYDSNPYNKLGNEYILMSKAPGTPLSFVFSHLDDDELHALMRNLANLIIPLSAHRFSQTGSLYQHAKGSPTSSGIRSTTSSPSSSPLMGPAKSDFIVGPIVSWPFFGEGRGELDHTEIDRGPWSSTASYLEACARREIDSVRREAGAGTGHRPHLPPASRARPSTRSYHNRHQHSATTSSAYPSSDESESDDLSDAGSESSEENFYRDYRSSQRSSMLVAKHASRLNAVTDDMARFTRYMTRDLGVDDKDPEFAGFAFHLHDLSLANIFVDPEDHSKITCIIDWESTTIRPFWLCAHLPAFIQPTPHNLHAREAAIFRSEVAKLGPLGQMWLRAEKERAPWREAHRFLEWDGWEEHLLETVIGDKGNLKEGEGVWDFDGGGGDKKSGVGGLGLGLNNLGVGGGGGGVAATATRRPAMMRGLGAGGFIGVL